MSLGPIPRDLEVQVVDIRSLYSFHDVLGTGRTGTVYRCIELGSQDSVAIKVIRSQEIDGFNEYRLCQWIESFKEADIDGVAKFHNIYTDSTRKLFYIVMKYYPNGSVRSYTQRIEGFMWGKCGDMELLTNFHRIVFAIAFIHEKMWLVNTATVGVTLGGISSNNLLVDEDLSFCILPGIGAALGWVTKNFNADCLYNEVSTLTPEKIEKIIQCINRPAKSSSIVSYMKKTAQPDFQTLYKYKSLLFKSTYATDNWALGYVLFEVLFHKPPFGSSKDTLIANIRQGKLCEVTSIVPKVLEQIIHGLLTIDPKKRLSVEQASKLLALSQGQSERAEDALPHQDSNKLIESLYVAHLKHMVSTMDESLAKLSSILLNTVHSQTEALEENARLSIRQSFLEKDLQAKENTLQKLRAELTKIKSNLTIEISKASDVDTDSLTNEELDCLENECKLILDKITKSRLIRHSPECVICLSRPKNMKFDPCKHVCTCKECYIQLIDKRCPICRTVVSSVEKVFF